MITCTCGKEVKQGEMCPNCARIFCSECSSKLGCPFCGKELAEIKIRDEKFSGRLVQWISDGSGWEIGLSDFKELPRNILHIPKKVAADQKIKFLMFPNKKSSETFNIALCKYLECERPKYLKKPLEESRYALVLDSQTEKAFVLLNNGAISDVSVMEFLTNVVCDTLKTTPIIRSRIEEPIVQILWDTLQSYNKKFAIDFLWADPDLVDLSKILVNNLSSVYSEYKALRRNIQEGYIDAASQVISHKLEVLPKAITWKDLDFLLEIYCLLGVCAHIFTIIASVEQKEPLKRYVRAKFEKIYSTIIEKLRTKSDLIKAVEALKETMSDAKVYASEETWIQSVASGFRDAFAHIEPKYVWMSEVIPLAKACQTYLNQIEEGIEPYIPEFGSLDNFIDRLTKVFRSKATYLEVPLLAGRMLTMLLNALLRRDRNRSVYRKFLTIGKEYSRLMEENVEKIRKTNPGSPIHSFDSALVLNNLSMWSWRFGELQESNRLRNKAATVARKHKLVTIEFIINWQDFLLTHDYDNIQHISRLFNQVKRDKFAKIEKHLMTIGLLSVALLDEEKKFENYKNAIESSLDVQTEYITSPYAIEKALLESSITHHIVQIFYLLELAQKQPSKSEMIDYLVEARLHARALQTQIDFPNAPESIFVLKTYLIINLINNDVSSTSENIKKIRTFARASPYLRNFIRIVEKCASVLYSTQWKKFIDLLEFPMELRDPWIRITQEYIRTMMRRKISEFPSKILFVEGKTDKIILSAFARRVGISLEGIEIIPVEGKNKARYHLTTWTKDTCKMLPFFVILDSDAKEDADALVKQGILRDNYHLWKKGCIENYYPIAILEKALKKINTRYNLDLEIGEILEKIRKGRLSPQKIQLGHKRSLIKRPWKILLAETMAEILSTEKTVKVEPELKQILNRITS